MARTKKVKKEIKVLKEISRDVREVKRDKNGNGEEEAEEESDNGRFEGGNGFASGGNRTAPVLQSETLEQVTASAPAPARNTGNNDDNAGAGNGYSANYAARYSNQEYENREQEQAVRPTVRSAGAIGGLIEPRNADFSDLRRTQNLWRGDGQNSGAWEPDRVNLINDDRKYAEDKRQEDAKMMEKRRRMM